MPFCFVVQQAPLKPRQVPRLTALSDHRLSGIGIVSFEHYDNTVRDYGKAAASIENIAMTLKVKRQADGSPLRT